MLVRLAAMSSDGFSPTPSFGGTAELSPGIGPGNPAAFQDGQKLRPTFVI
jgi:hypothetical protein